MKKPELSIIILNFNTKELLKDLLESLEGVKNEADFEIIVVDNASTDGSVEMLKKDFGEVRLIKNSRNFGFAKGNNKARRIAKGAFVLFLNPDTVIGPGAISKTLEYLKKDEKAGAITCKILLPDGSLDKDARRRFPTPWISFKRLFLGMGGEYWYSDIPDTKIHEVDAIQGAFFLARRKILDEVGWFDEDYFLNGEDIDLCWKIKQKGYKIIYFPEVSIIHRKKASKGKAGREAKSSGVDAMEIFYRKRLWKQYPLIFNYLVIFGIKILKILRTL